MSGVLTCQCDLRSRSRHDRLYVVSQSCAEFDGERERNTLIIPTDCIFYMSIFDILI